MTCEIRRLVQTLEADEELFAKLLEDKTNADGNRERKTIQQTLAKDAGRMKDILRLYEKLYEDNANGKVSDSMFMQLSKKYEDEQDEIKARDRQLTERLHELQKQKSNKDRFLRAVRRFMEIQTLTPTILHELIDRIVVEEAQGTGQERTQRITIVYRFVGQITLPEPTKPLTKRTRKGVAVAYTGGAEN